jgi:pyruvate/2-oxoglutarate/acetoin dehydrogenase E1 component
VERARAGGGPSFIEAKTYRFLGHYVGDPALYMPKEERELWAERDATLKLGRQLRAWGYLSEDEDAKLAADVAKELEEAIEFAKSSPKPPPEDALTDAYGHFDYRGNPLGDAGASADRSPSIGWPGREEPLLQQGAHELREISYRDALREALREEMLRDERVFLMGEDIADPFGSAYKVTLGLSPEFGTDRVRQTPISELGFVGAGVGAALTGMRPVVELMYIDFSTLPMDQIANQAAKIRYMSGGQAQVPLVIRTQGGMGRSSAAHHAQSLEAWFVHIPGLLVAMPSTPYDAKGLLKTAIRLNDPVMFIEHKLLYNTEGPVPDEEYTIPFGVADVKREGTDCTVVATSRTVLMALQAAEILAQEGISLEVIDPRTLFPLDVDTIVESVKKTSRLVVAHESPERGGVAAEVIAQVADKGFGYIDAPIQRVCAPSVPTPFARHLEDFIIVNETHIADRVRRLVRGEI